MAFAREIVEFEKLENGKLHRARVEVFPDFASLFAEGTEVIFQTDPDFREKAIRFAENLGYVRLPPVP
jgi:hypothetical protein